MPGMNSGLSPGDPVLIAAFRSALLHQGAIVLLMILLLGLVGATLRVWPTSTAGADRGAADGAAGAGLDISDTPEGTRWQPAETG